MRGKGEGSIYKRADGRWVGSVALEPGADGKRRRSTVYGKTRREVQAKLDQTRQAVGQGREPVAHGARVTVGELLDEWLDAIQKPTSRLRELTQGQYVVAANTRVRPQLGRLPVVRLNDDRLTEWQDELLAANYAPRSVLKARIVINAVILLARRRKLLHANPLELVEPPQTQKPKKRAISGEEAGRFLRALRGHPLEMMIMAMLLTGARRGEQLGWAWSDIDLDAATVRMRQQVQRLPARTGRRSLAIVETKTEASERVMPLPSLLVERLRAYQVEHARRWPDVDLVFPSSRGTPMDPRRFNRAFKELIEQAGLAPLTPHELRHSVSTVLLNLGVPAVVVGQLLGHADPSVTLRWYSHEIPEAHREAMGRMDEYIRRLDQEHGGSATRMAIQPPAEERFLSSDQRNRATPGRLSQS